MDFSFSTHFTLAQSQHSCSCLRAVHLVLSGRKGSALKIRSTRSAMMIRGMTMMSVRRFLNYHVFVSQVTHWYSSRRRERVEEVTEKVSLVHARTHRHTDTHTAGHLLHWGRYARLPKSSFSFFKAVLRRPSCSRTQHKLAAQTLVHVLGTLTGQEVIGDLKRSTQVKVAHHFHVPPAVFVIVFRNARVMFMSAKDSVHYQLSVATGHETSSTKD